MHHELKRAYMQERKHNAKREKIQSSDSLDRQTLLCMSR